MEKNDLFADAVAVCQQLKIDKTPAEIARWVGRSRQTVTQNWNEAVPLEHVATIAEKTGMTKLQIRPDREDLFGD